MIFEEEFLIKSKTGEGTVIAMAIPLK